MRYRVNEPAVAFHEVDREIIIIHLESGYYYNLNAAGSSVWKLLAAGHEEKAILAAADDAKTPEKSLEVSLREFINTLREEDLLTESSRDLPPDSHAPLSGWSDLPVCSKFTDMQQLLLSDPVHDVDSKGWPHIKKNPE